MMADITIKAQVEIPDGDMLRRFKKGLSVVVQKKANAQPYKRCTKEILFRNLIEQLYLPSAPCMFGPLHVYEWKVRHAKQIKVLELRDQVEIELDRELWKAIDTLLLV